MRNTLESCWMIKKPPLIQWGQSNLKYFGQSFTLALALLCWRPDNAVQSNHCNFAKYFFTSIFYNQSWYLLLSYLAYISIWLECKFFALPALKSHPSFLITIHANLVVIRPTLRDRRHQPGQPSSNTKLHKVFQISFYMTQFKSINASLNFLMKKRRCFSDWWFKIISHCYKVEQYIGILLWSHLKIIRFQFIFPQICYSFVVGNNNSVLLLASIFPG